MPEAKLRVGVLASGRGSNLQAIIDAIEAGKLAARIAVVISNKKDAQALERARLGYASERCAIGCNASGLGPGNRAVAEDQVAGPGYAGAGHIHDRVGWRHAGTEEARFHPALLPSFPGLKAQQQALDWGVKVSGCTVHFVTEGVDIGPIIRQAAVPVLENDTVETLEARILAEEHRIYPEAIQLFAEGRLSVEGRRVRIR